MDIKLIMFSPTGGTERCARAVCGGMADGVEAIDLCDPAFDGARCVLGPDDVVCVAMPSFGGRMPHLAGERLASIRGGGARCVLICVYGNRAYDSTLVEMEATSRACGLATVAAITAVASNSVARSAGAGRPDDADTALLERFGAEIRKKFEAGEVSMPTLPGRLPTKPASNLPFVPRPTGDCDGCGTCAARCPVGAIDRADPRRVDKGRCAACMRCTAVCPRSARRLGPVISGLASLALRLIASRRREPELFI